MTQKECPEQETLQQLLLGNVSEAGARHLEEHLLHCETCSAAADTLTDGDVVTEALKARLVIDGDEEVIEQVIEQGKQLRSDIDTVEPGETQIRDLVDESSCHAATVASPAKALHEHIDFLHPSQQPDEIGRLGDYRVLDVMGVGGMGVVFRAEDPKLKRQVALKAMKPTIAASSAAKDRFLREAQATAAIEHDNIVSIYQVGEDRGIPFIAMRYLKGESLQRRLRRERRLDQREVVRIGKQIAAGLAAAHERGLIHRDIKPDNIWLEMKGKGGSMNDGDRDGTSARLDRSEVRVKILDFGLARTTEDDAGLTQTGVVLGTPR